MTSRERVAALIRGEPVDRVPLMLFGGSGFCARNAGYLLADAYGNPEKSFHAQVKIMEQFDFYVEPYLNYASYGAWEFGGEAKLPSGEWEQAPKIVRTAVESEEDAWNLKLPDVTRAGLLPRIMEFCKLAVKHDLPAVVTCGSPFTHAGNICGVERLCRWIIKKPDLVHHVLRLATDHILEVVKYWVDTFGAERVNGFDGVTIEANQIISPKQFVEFALPYIEEVHEKVMKMGVKRFSHFHICGEHNQNLPYLAEVPVDASSVASFGHEVDIATAIKYFGNKCIIAGNVNTSLIQTGTPQQVYDACRDCIEKGKKAPRGYALMAGCALPPKAPLENVYMMKKAVDDFGWYN